MYTVLLNGSSIHDPALNDSSKIIFDGVVTKKVNCADSFTFTIYPSNAGYGSLSMLTSSVEVYKDGALIFHGRPLSEETGWDNQKKVVCEGDLAIFNDTVLRPYEYSGTVADYVRYLVNQHNAQVGAGKQITVRHITVTDPNDYIVRSCSNYVKTLQELMDKTVGHMGGYLVTEYDDGSIYLDYLADSTSGTNQALAVGKNILDFQRSLSSEALATALIPLGATDEETGERVTIKSVNSGSDYISDATAVSERGLIFTTCTWDDVTVPANLLTKAQAVLTNLTRMVPRIQLSAVDLTNAGYNVDAIGFFEYVTVVDTAHNVSGQYLITERSWNISAPENDTVTFGSEDQTISGQTARGQSTVDRIYDTVINKAAAIIDYQTDLLKGGAGGYVVTGTDEDGHPSELYFMDTDSTLTAMSVLRLNKNGIGFSTTGFSGPYTNAWTIDGNLNASFLYTGIIKDSTTGGNKFYLNLDTGEVRLESLDLVAQKLDNLGGRNLIINTYLPDAKRSKRPRLYEQTYDTVISNGTVTTATHGMRLTMTTAAQPVIYFGARQISSEDAGLNGLTAGNTYTMSADVAHKLLSNYSGSTTYKVMARLRTAASADNSWTISSEYVIREVVPGQARYPKMVWTFTVPATATKLYISIFCDDTTAADYATTDYLQLSNIKLERGEVATAWTPAPEDQVGCDEIISKINVSPEQITIQAERVSLAGKTIDLTSDNIVISSTNFSVSKDGVITATSGHIGRYEITNTYLRAYGTEGDGSTCVGMGGNQAFWAGSNSSNSAPYRVSYSGELVSTSGNIGGWEITSSRIQKQIMSGSNVQYRAVLYAPASPTGSTAAFCIADETGSSTTYPLRLEYDGTLRATKAIITGAVTATSGEIGGFTIDSTSIRSAALTETSNGAIALSTANFTRAISGTDRVLRFAIGAKFGVASSGILYAKDAVIDGEITASTGTIGRYEITSTFLRAYGTDGDSTTCTGMGGNQAFWAGAATSSSAPFRVSYAGALTATNATITGSVTATSGEIGGFTIDSSSIRSAALTSTSAGAIGISTAAFTRTINGTSRTLRFAVGSKFGVTSSGVVYAADADITGTITASAGTIAGWELSNTQLQKLSAVTEGTASTQYRAFLQASPGSNGGNRAFSICYRSYDGTNYGSYTYPFSVFYNGKIEATNADISGKITATSGSIAGSLVTSGIDADNITAGTLSVARLSANSIKAAKLDLDDIFSQSITATNFKLSGGSVDITTTSQSTSKIKLSGNGYSTSMAAEGITLTSSAGTIFIGDKSSYGLLNVASKFQITSASGITVATTSYGNLANTGLYSSASASSSVSLASATSGGTNLTSVTLAAGKWMVAGAAVFASNATGFRRIALSTTSGSSATGFYQSTRAISGYATYMSTAGVFSLSSSATVYLVGLQNSGSALNVTSADIKAVRVI